MRTNTVKQALREGRATVGTWLSLNSPASAGLMAGAGFDWLVVDEEHCAIDYETAAQLCQAVGSGPNLHNDDGNAAFVPVPVSHRERDPFAFFINPDDNKLPWLGFLRYTGSIYLEKMYIW